MRGARTTAYSVICLLLTLGVAWGQQPKRLPLPPPGPLPLLPAEPAWLVTLPSPPAAGGAMDEQHVYVPRQDDRLVALDRQTGQLVWERNVETAWPVVAADSALFIAASDDLHALDATTGMSRWRVPLERPLLAPFVYDTGWLLLVLEQGDVIGIRAADGQELWRSRIGRVPVGAPVPGGRNALYLSTDDGHVLALALDSGRLLWDRTLPGTLSVPSTAPGRVFVGSTDNFFYALDADDGDVEWKWRSGGDVIGSAAGDDIVVFVSLDNIIRGVNRGNGNQRWRKETGTRPVLPPRVYDRLAVLSGIAPALTGFDLRTGAVTGTYAAPGAVQGEPLIDEQLRPYDVAVAIVMRDGQVTGLRPTAMLFREQPALPLTTLPGRPLEREAAAGVR